MQCNDACYACMTCHEVESVTPITNVSPAYTSVQQPFSWLLSLSPPELLAFNFVLGRTLYLHVCQYHFVNFRWFEYSYLEKVSWAHSGSYQHLNSITVDHNVMPRASYRLSWSDILYGCEVENGLIHIVRCTTQQTNPHITSYNDPWHSPSAVHTYCALYQKNNTT